MAAVVVASPGWQPSGLRTIDVPAPLPMRGATAAMIPLCWVPKAAAEVLDYRFGLSEWLEDASDAVARITAVWVTPQADPLDLAVLWSTVLSGDPVLLLGGGLPGTSYTIAVQLCLASGRIAAFAAELAIDTRTPAVAAPSAPTAAIPDQLDLLTPLGPLLIGATPLLVPAGTASSAVPIPPNAIAATGGILLLDDGSPLLLA